MFDKLFEKINVVEQAAPAPTKPEAPPAEPSAPPIEKPKRRRSPLKPEPGIHPKPKASLDLDLFKKARAAIVKEMAFDPGDFPSFIHSTKKKWIEAGDEEINKLLPSLGGAEMSYLEMITSDAYQGMIRNLEKLLDVNASELDVPQIMSVVFQSLRKVQQIESQNKEALEKLAVEVVMELPEMALVKDAYEEGDFELDAQLGTPDLAGALNADMEAPQGELSQAEATNAELAKGLEDATEDVLQRRMANILIQGSATLKLHLFHA
ncbi:MAG: hypothetical protein ACTSWQ_08475, partial [Candidatus Thorarchaeota archaeon]